MSGSNLLSSSGLLQRKSTLSFFAPQRDVNVIKQTEKAFQEGTWESVVRKGNVKEAEAFFAHHPEAVSERGAVGETALHMAFLFNTENHQNIAKYLLNHHPNAITAQYNEELYNGENCLHIAIINKQIEMVDLLLDTCTELQRKELLSAAADGIFFQRGKPCYFGEYPLFFAACTNQRAVFQKLLLKGADLSAQDSNGNTVLHLMVIHNRPEMHRDIVELWPKWKAAFGVRGEELWDRVNKDGLTPFTLAARDNNKDMFAFLLQRSKKEVWSYGPVTCNRFPLKQLDICLEPERRVVSALEVVVREAHVELLLLPRVLQIIDKKWECFARRIFIQRLIVTVLFLLLFTAANILKQRTHDQWWLALLGTVVDVVVGGAALCQAITDLQKEQLMGWRAYWGDHSGSHKWEKGITWLFCACLFAVYVTELFELHSTNRALRAVASLLAWSYMLFFLLGFRLTGPFVVMIYKMLVADVLRFCIIYAIFLLGFSQAFFVLFNFTGVVGFARALRMCFAATVGAFEIESFTTDTSVHPVTGVLFVVYVVVVTIMLLNLLVAMMGNTYTAINEAADSRWHLERARIIVAIESKMSHAERNSEANKYWAVIDGERYLQVEEVDPLHFSTKAKDE